MDLKGLDALFWLSSLPRRQGVPPKSLTWPNFDQSVVLNEDGVAGQVAMDDWRVTGVEVAGYLERTVVRKQSQIEVRIPPPIPSPEYMRGKQECRGYVPRIAGRYNSVMVHQYLSQDRTRTSKTGGRGGRKQASSDQFLQNPGYQICIIHLITAKWVLKGLRFYTKRSKFYSVLLHRASQKHTVLYKHDQSRFPPCTDRTYQCWGSRYSWGWSHISLCTIKDCQLPKVY